MVREVAEEGLAPPLGVHFAAAVVEVLVRGGAVVERAVVEHERDVVLHVERAVGVVADAGEAEPPSSRPRGRGPGRRWTGRPFPCRRWRRCDPSWSWYQKKDCFSARRRPRGSSGRGCRPSHPAGRLAPGSILWCGLPSLFGAVWALCRWVRKVQIGRAEVPAVEYVKGVLVEVVVEPTRRACRIRR